uniref:DUF3086 domain-containing protein n=1 Tax=Paulinella longichromatophora TaxID=1708747 RepID=A0A2H4ZNZ4_9EUKA|nr:hypothetical protein PLO_204 [Paulinella longichromatophora]
MSDNFPKGLNTTYNQGTEKPNSSMNEHEYDLKIAGEKPKNNPINENNIISSNILFNLALKELQERRNQLQNEIKELEQRRDHIQNDITKNSLTHSDEIARKLKGFQTYLIGALQDLTASAEQIELFPQTLKVQPSLLDQTEGNKSKPPDDLTAAGAFSIEEDFIRRRLRKLADKPTGNNEAWKLRRILDKSFLSLIEDWFFNQGGRGVQESGGDRSQNILVAAAIISILGELYGDRFQTLVLAGRPEQLGEWRRGLQDCLGLARQDFGPNSGIMLFETANNLVECADRLEYQSELPFIIVDMAEQKINTSILRFPLILAFTSQGNEFFDESELL